MRLLPHARHFATWMIQRAAIRESRTAGGGVIFRGNFQGITYARPVRALDETDRRFQERVHAWRSRVPRGNTFPEALALAHEALVKDGYCDWNAAHVLRVDVLPQVRAAAQSCKRIRREQRIPWIDLAPMIGRSKWARRTKRRSRGFNRGDRMTERVRTGVARYKRECPSFDQRFEMWYSVFASQNSRDAAWHAKTEASWRECLTNRETRLGPHHQLVGEAAFLLARHYHAHANYFEAETLYRRARSIWLGEPTLGLPFRALLLHEAAIGIGRCASKLPVTAGPAYAGPRFLTCRTT